MRSASVKPKTVNDYIALAPKETRAKLRQMRTIVNAAAPKSTEAIKWGLPCVSYKRMLVAYGAFKQHIGFYPTPAAILAFSDELKPYVTARGSVQFPLANPLPARLIREMTKFRVQQSLDKDALWKPSPKRK